jgi:hypothetical protein
LDAEVMTEVLIVLLADVAKVVAVWVSPPGLEV